MGKQAVVDRLQPWRGGRVVDGSGLENRRAERHRGFESHLLRFLLSAISQDCDLNLLTTCR
jgi:hypothetical protein